MKCSSYAILAWACLALAQRHGEEESRSMGPVAFLWPPDREWGAAVDNTPPCGSSAAPGNRTEFPLVNGQVALVMQDEAYSIRISISYASNPAANEDFVTVTDSRYIPDVDPGHECYPLPSPPENVTEGSNATLQIQYVADFDDQGNDSGNNETFYACADVTFVPADQFTFQVPCFNTSGVELGPIDDEGGDSDSAGSSSGATEGSSSDGGRGGLPGGTIAGIVVGVVAGVALIVVGAFLIWRLRQQRERLRNQQGNVRAVKWDGDGGSSTGGGDAIGLKNLPASR